MSQHLLVRGAGAGKWLPWARAQLANLRETTGLWAFGRLSRIQGAKVHVRWAGDEEWIYIVVAGEIIFGFSPSSAEPFPFQGRLENIIGVTKVFGRARTIHVFPQTDPPPPPSGAPYFVSSASPVGGRRLLLVIGQHMPPGYTELTYRVYDSIDGGVTVRLLPVTFDPIFFNNHRGIRGGHGGPVFNEGGAVVGNRYLLFGFNAFEAGLGADDRPALFYSNDAGGTWNSTVIDFPAPDPPADALGFDGVVGTYLLFVPPVAIGRNRLLAVAGGIVFGKLDEAHGSTWYGTADLKPIQSEDGGATWSALGGGVLTTDLNTEEIFWVRQGSFNIALAGLDTPRLMALGNDKVIFTAIAAYDDGNLRSYTSLDGGVTWSAHVNALSQEAGEALPTFGTRFDPIAIGNNSAAFRYTPLTFVSSPFGETFIVRTLDSGQTWERLPIISLGRPRHQFGGPSVYSRASPDPEDEALDLPNAIIAMPIFNTDATWLYTSGDSGVTWKKGARLASGDGTVLGTGKVFLHLGSMQRPQPANIGAPGLYSA